VAVPVDEIDAPKVSLNTPDNDVFAPTENLSGSVRLDRITNRRAYGSRRLVESNIMRFVRSNAPVAWSST